MYVTKVRVVAGAPSGDGNAMGAIGQVKQQQQQQPEESEQHTPDALPDFDMIKLMEFDQDLDFDAMFAQFDGGADCCQSPATTGVKKQSATAENKKWRRQRSKTSHPRNLQRMIFIDIGLQLDGFSTST